MDVHLGAHGTHSLDVIHQFFKVSAVLGPDLHVLIARPQLGHDGLAAAGQGLIDLLGDERHEGMQQLQCAIQHIHQHLAGGVGGLGVVAVQAGLANFDVPVAVHFPNKVLHLLGGQAQLVLIQVGGGVGGHLGQLAQHPLVAHVQLVLRGQAGMEVFGQVHLHKAGSIPQLVGKVTGSQHLFIAVTHIVAGGGTDDEHQA